tara:strand:+ start:1117 stop:1476 length:360 start_codon:yes stop_codon:yes gene_type:complete
MSIRNRAVSLKENHDELDGITKLGRAFFVRTLMDSLGNLNPTSSFGVGVMKVEVSTAKSFFNEHKPQFILMCELAQIEPGYMIRLFDELVYQKNRGTFKKHKLNIKVVVERIVSRCPTS